MMVVVLVLLANLMVQETTCQFAPHMDFQKIDEVKFRNTKYNILKPTVHLTKDHFKDFIQQRDDSDFPGRKKFVDKNGIRHYWSGFDVHKPKVLRKDLQTNGISSNQVKKSDDKTPGIKSKDNDYKQHIEEIKTNGVKVQNVTVKVKTKPHRKKKVSKLRIEKVADTQVLRGDENRQKVKTTFFCPFFGVITMVSYIHDDQ